VELNNLQLGNAIVFDEFLIGFYRLSQHRHQTPVCFRSEHGYRLRFEGQPRFQDLGQRHLLSLKQQGGLETGLFDDRKMNFGPCPLSAPDADEVLGL
jgi:hypothetical protein